MSRQTQRASCSSGPRRGPDRRRTLRHACPHRLAVASTNRSRQSGPRRPQPGRVVRIGAGCTLQCNMPAKWLGRCRADQAPLVYLFPLPYADLGACDTVIPAVPPAIAGRAMWGPASAGGSPHHAPFLFLFPVFFRNLLSSMPARIPDSLAPQVGPGRFAGLPLSLE